MHVWASGDKGQISSTAHFKNISYLFLQGSRIDPGCSQALADCPCGTDRTGACSFRPDPTVQTGPHLPEALSGKELRSSLCWTRQLPIHDNLVLPCSSSHTLCRTKSLNASPPSKTTNVRLFALCSRDWSQGDCPGAFCLGEFSEGPSLIGSSSFPLPFLSCWQSPPHPLILILNKAHLQVLNGSPSSKALLSLDLHICIVLLLLVPSLLPEAPSRPPGPFSLKAASCLPASFLEWLLLLFFDVNILCHTHQASTQLDNHLHGYPFQMT